MPEPSSSSRSHLLSGLLGALVVAIVFGALALGGVFDGEDGRDASGSTPIVRADSDSESPDPEPKSPGSVVATDVSDLYANVRQGVVSIQTRTAGGGATGSGFVLDKDGNILTNDHVVEDAKSVRVQFGSSKRVTAQVRAKDPSTDLALIKVDPQEVTLEPVPLGASDDLKVGQPAIAIGSPFGLAGTLTTGVISSLGRTIEAPNNFQIDQVVQTDAAINPGNSGGPLLDSQGRVIGVNAQIATSSQSNSGVGFAIPIDTAKEILPDLKAGREIERPYLGVSTTDPASGAGAVVATVVPGGPADDAGLRSGDRILSFDGKPVKDSAQVASRVTAKQPGDSVKVELRRGGTRRTETVRLGTRPKTPAGAGSPRPPGGGGIPLPPGRP